MFAIIPARKGSIGLPNKNIKKFNGTPLIEHCLKIILSSKIFSKIYISTDSKKIMNICNSFNESSIRCLKRPKYLSQSTSLAHDVYKFVLNHLIKNKEISLNDFFFIFQITSPLITKQDILNCFHLINKNTYSIISMAESTIPPHWNLELNKSNKIKAFFDGYSEKKNRQSYKRFYYPNGAIKVLKVKHFINDNTYYSLNKTNAYIMPKERSVDIDDIHDFRIAEILNTKL